MKFLYSFAVFLVSMSLRIVAIFNKKIKLFVDGRKETFHKIADLKKDKTIWFHAASLGEFEQARPIIEDLKKNHNQSVFSIPMHFMKKCVTTSPPPFTPHTATFIIHPS